MAAVTSIHVRFRGMFVHIIGQLADASMLLICRLCYVGYASPVVATYRADYDDLQESYMSGAPVQNPRASSRMHLRPLPLSDPCECFPPGTDTPGFRGKPLALP